MLCSPVNRVQIRLRLRRLVLRPSVQEVLDSLVIYGAQLGRRPDEQNLSLVQHGDTIGDLEGAVQIMGHDDDRRPERVAKLQQQVVDGGRHRGIEAGRRLVAQQDPRIERERPGERRALDHAARKLRRHQRLEAGEADELQLQPAHDAHRPAIEARQLHHRQHDVLADGHRAEQGAALEGDPQSPARVAEFGGCRPCRCRRRR